MMIDCLQIFAILFLCVVVDSISSNSPEIYLYSFSSQGNKFNEDACLSTVTAILAGWQLHMVSIVKEKKLALGGKFNNKLIKIYAIYEIVKSHNDNDIILFVDAFDVVFQNDVSRFLNIYAGMDLKGKILYNSEQNCFPSGQAHYDCPIFKGRSVSSVNAAVATAPSSSSSLTCDLQERLAPANYSSRYLNSGVFIGSAKSIRELYEYIIEVNVDTPNRCRGDQQLVSWVYGLQLQPIVLDFDQVLLAAMFGEYSNFYFSKNRGVLSKNKQEKKNSKRVQPFALHFNGDKVGYVYTVRKLVRWHVSLHGKAEAMSRLEQGRVYVDGVKQDFLKICNISKILPHHVILS